MKKANPLFPPKAAGKAKGQGKSLVPPKAAAKAKGQGKKLNLP